MNAQTKKSGSAKMSHSGKVAQKPKSRARKFVRAVFWILSILIIIAGITLAFIWHYRTELMESQVRNLMAKNGYDVALNIRKLSKTNAVVTDIIVSKDKSAFFKADRMVVDYDINKRMAQRIELIKPYINIEFDTKGKITSTWMMQSTGEGQKLLLPPNGLVIKDAIVDWRLMRDKETALGSGRANVTADIINDKQWSANAAGTKATFSTDLFRGDIQHSVFIETTDGKSFDVFGSVDGQNIATTLVPIDNFRASLIENEFKFNFVRANATEKKANEKKANQKPVLSGWYNAHISEVSVQDYKAEDIDLKIEQLRLDAQGRISTNWQLNTKAAQISNIDMRKELADKLTSQTTMANMPIAKFFTTTLYNKAERLLGGFDLNGQGAFLSSESGYEINIDRPLRLKAPNQEMILTKPQNRFFQYNKANKKITVQADIDWSGAQALNLTNFTMAAKSFQGTRIDAVQNIKAHVRSTKEWRLHNAKDKGGDDVRLAPFDIEFAYADKGNGLRNVNIGGGIDYDGPVPGGYVLGLVAGGDMQVQLRGSDFTLGYNPSGPLFIDEFTNPSGWTTKALKFTLEPQVDLLSKTANSGMLHTTLRDVSTQLIGPEDKRHLDARFERLDVSTDFANSPQHWQVLVSGTEIKSDDFPAPGTHIVSPISTLNVYQSTNNNSSGGDMTFDILSPKTSVSTDNATITNLNIGLRGSPDDIALEYRAGSVTMVGGAVPTLPMHGTARLKLGELTGHAITNLPRTKDTPIDIHYRSQDGQGSAKILIPKIIFEPSGLQPQHLVPVLRGKLADVSGEISAEFDFVFGGGEPVRSSGSTELINLNIGTLVGPISGINSKLTLSSVFPLETDGIQTATLTGFDPGFPLKNGTIKFEIVPDGVTIYEAAWPIENIANDNEKSAPGKIFLTPTDWQFGDVENRVAVNIENVGLGTMLAGIGKDKFSATGQVYGTLPAKIKGVDVLIEDGVLAIKDGGVIRYKSAATDAAAARNENAGHAFRALENFQYRQLEARIDGPIDGAMALKIIFDGKNPEVLAGQPFQFNTVISGELANIARNMAGAFSNEENLSRILEIQNGKRAEQP